ncbi:pyridoxamine 5'-phosphate oxidase family protein [Methanolapillus millepedarum]|uniref:Pyridoxamine 5'-phosphate oxidase N-terminal domain-containing protein n=1 Tax=Methanolapillus millepedarum TaxID=3028296 RepID=A0AA96V352_9EURY|nr:hypothetical protein MsAc7_07590 [Methanosarcinaceae archaeon Ac7]
MIDYSEILKANSSGVLATQNDEKVDTRVVQCLFTEGSKAYFCTSCEKPMYDQLVRNPNVSFCVHPQNYSPVLSVSGKVTFVEDQALKARVLAVSPMSRNVYKTPDNPVFKVFYIEIEDVKTYSFADGTKHFTI